MELKNTKWLPREVLPILQQHANILVDILGLKLVGVYVHGSAAMGGFSPSQSDIDYLAIVSSPLSFDERAKLAEAFLRIYDISGFKKGIEMSIVEERFVGKDFVYPTPYEFHMGTKEQVVHHGKPHDQTGEADPDLASYFVVIQERGVSIYGKEISDVFGSIDRKYYWRSVQHDLKSASQGIYQDPVYHILNLCRTLYGLKNDSVYSKKEGAEFFLADSTRKDDEEVVRAALDTYQKGVSFSLSMSKVESFTKKLLSEIEHLFTQMV